MIVAAAVHAHDPITTKLTWTREISRIVYARCASCHRPGGKAFSLLTYKEARPWAVAIAEEVMERRMPPWGAVKGFGEFRNDQSLTQEQIGLIAQWVAGGAPEGDAKDMPPRPKPARESTLARGVREIAVHSEYTFDAAAVLDGIRLQSVPAGASMQITATLPDGSVEPLVWLLGYDAKYAHPFLLREPLPVPRGTVIRGVTKGTSVVLLVTTPAAAPGRRSARYSPLRPAGTAPTAGTSARAEKSN